MGVAEHIATEHRERLASAVKPNASANRGQPHRHRRPRRPARRRRPRPPRQSHPGRRRRRHQPTTRGSRLTEPAPGRPAFRSISVTGPGCRPTRRRQARDAGSVGVQSGSTDRNDSGSASMMLTSTSPTIRPRTGPSWSPPWRTSASLRMENHSGVSAAHPPPGLWRSG
jgi:hypothetical protein